MKDRLVSVREEQARQDGQIVGREADIAQLEQCLETALSGKRQLVFVTGESGIGKTTVVDTFLASVSSRSDLWLSHGQCVEQYGAGEAYMPVLEAIGRLCQTPDSAPRIETLLTYAPTWLAQLPSLLTEDERQALQRQVHDTTQERMLREIADALAAFTADHGMVLVLEDLHWSDASTLECLAYLAQRREPAKLLILGTYRPTERFSSEHPLQDIVHELQARGQCQELRLAPLSADTVQAYLTRRFARQPVPAQLSQLIHQRTSGNPLFIVNTVNYLINQGLLREIAGQWTVQDDIQLVAQAVPDSLRHLIEKQFERLSNDTQRLLEVASTEGNEFSTLAVAAGLQTELEDVERHCETLGRLGHFIRPLELEEWPDQTLSSRYSFIHALYQNVLYERIAATRRSRLHHRIGTRKEAAYGDQVNEIAAELARHFEVARDAERAVEYNRRAAEVARRRSAHREAIAHLRRGLAVLKQTKPPTPYRLEHELRLQTALGTSLMAIKGYAAPEVEHTYARAHELCAQIGDSPRLFPVLGGLWAFYNARAQLHTARELAVQILDLAQRIDKSLPLHLSHAWLGQTLFCSGEFVSSRKHFEQAIGFYDVHTHNPRSASLPQDNGEVSLAYTAWVLWLLGYPDQALKTSQAACALAQQISHPFSQTHALNFAAFLHQARGETLLVQHRIEAAMALLQDQETPYRLAQSTILQGWALAAQGDPETGLTQLQQGVEAWCSTGAEQLHPYYLALLAEAYHHAGQPQAGLDTVTKALARVQDTQEHHYEAELYRLRGELLLAREVKSQNEAEECFHTALEIARRQEAKSFELRAALSLSKLWQQQGKTAEARQLLEEIYGWFTEGFDTQDLQDTEILLTVLGSHVERTPPKVGTPISIVPAVPAPDDKTLPTPQSETVQEVPASVVPESSDDSAASPVASSSAYIFRKEGESWILGFEGKICRLKDLRGIQYLAQLVYQPNTQIHALTLFSGNPSPPLSPSAVQTAMTQLPPDANQVLAPHARTAYKQRLEELQADLAEAREFNDLGRMERLQEEIVLLTQELTQTIGLGGQSHKARPPAERARTNVAKAIKVALKRIADTHPALAEHLSQTVRTGTFCVYTTDPRFPIHWQG